MSNNKPKSSVTPVSQHLQNKGNSNNPKDVIAAANAAQAAKLADAKAPEAAKTEEQPKAPVNVAADNANKEAPKSERVEIKEAPVSFIPSDIDLPTEQELAEFKKKKRLSSEDWVKILAYQKHTGLKAEPLAELVGTSTSNVYQQTTAAKKAAKEEAKRIAEEQAKRKAEEEAAKLSPSNVALQTKKLLEGVDDELKAFDDKVAEAQAIVDNAKTERAKIEASKNDYQAILDMLAKYQQA